MCPGTAYGVPDDGLPVCKKETELLSYRCMHNIYMELCVYSTLAKRQKGGERNPRNPHPMKRTNKQQKSRTQGAQP